MLNLSFSVKIIDEIFEYCGISQYFCTVIIKTRNQMNKKELDEKLEELKEILKNLNNSKHNYSYQLELYARDFFDILIDEIKN